MLAVSLAFPMAAQAKAWDFENGSYVDASGTPIEGAVAKGITVTKYQNRANRENGIDWGKVAADGIGFAMIRIGYYKDKDPYFDRNITEAAAHGIKTGVFFYTQALDAQTAADEAEYVLQVIKDFPVSYPVARVNFSKIPKSCKILTSFYCNHSFNVISLYYIVKSPYGGCAVFEPSTRKEPPAAFLCRHQSYV